VLREMRDDDLDMLFGQWADPAAAHMAAFTAPDHMDRDAFEGRWSRIRADETSMNRVIVVDGDVVGTICRGATRASGRSRTGSAAPTGAGDRDRRPRRVPEDRRVAAAPGARRLRQRRVAPRAREKRLLRRRDRTRFAARSREIEELVLRLDLA
jgi:hypothetical protein